MGITIIQMVISAKLSISSVIENPPATPAKSLPVATTTIYPETGKIGQSDINKYINDPNAFSILKFRIINNDLSAIKFALDAAKFIYKNSDPPSDKVKANALIVSVTTTYNSVDRVENSEISLKKEIKSLLSSFFSAMSASDERDIDQLLAILRTLSDINGFAELKVIFKEAKKLNLSKTFSAFFDKIIDANSLNDALDEIATFQDGLKSNVAMHKKQAEDAGVSYDSSKIEAKLAILAPLMKQLEIHILALIKEAEEKADQYHLVELNLKPPEPPLNFTAEMSVAWKKEQSQVNNTINNSVAKIERKNEEDTKILDSAMAILAAAKKLVASTNDPVLLNNGINKIKYFEVAINEAFRTK